MASAHRIVEVLDEKIVLTSPENGVTEVTEGSVEFDNVSFKYKEEAKEYALSDVTLKIKDRSDGRNPRRNRFFENDAGAAHSASV